GLGLVTLGSGCKLPQIRLERGNDSGCGVGHAPKSQKMKLHRRTVLSGTAAAVAAPFFTVVPAGADTKRQAVVDSCLGVAREVLGGKDFSGGGKPMAEGRGVAIIPERGQGGFIVGAAGGRGGIVVRTRPKDWSPPAFYGMGSGSLGLQIGAKVSKV